MFFFSFFMSVFFLPPLLLPLQKVRMKIKLDWWKKENELTECRCKPKIRFKGFYEDNSEKFHFWAQKRNYLKKNRFFYFLFVILIFKKLDFYLHFTVWMSQFYCLYSIENRTQTQKKNPYWKLFFSGYYNFFKKFQKKC